MPDIYFYEYRNNLGPNVSPDMWAKVKLVDNSDGTYSMAVRDDGSKAPANSYLNIAGAAATPIKSGAGVLKRIVINKPISLGVITLYDSVTAAGAKIGTITNPTILLQQQLFLDFDVSFTNGLTVKTSLADDITVIYR